MLAPIGGSVPPASAAHAARASDRGVLRGRAAPDHRRPPDTRLPAAAARASGRCDRRAAPERPRDRAGQRGGRDDHAGDGVRATLAADQQHGRERRHADRQPAEQRGARPRARRRARRARRRSDAGPPAARCPLTRGRAGYGAAQRRALGLEAPEAALVRAQQERRATRRERRGVDRRRPRPSVQRRRGVPVLAAVERARTRRVWRSPMRRSASTRPSLANANWSTTAPRSAPPGRTRFQCSPASIER